METRQKTSDAPAPAKRTKVRRREEETKEIDIEAPPALDEFLDDEEGNPGDRRRDPLRRP